MPHPFIKGQLVEQPAVRLFTALGWTALPASARLNSVLPPEAITAASLAGKGRVSPRDENPVFNETPALESGLGLIEWLTACCCMSLISNRFLFEWKTSL
jgi:hypothetical protein